MNHNPNHPSNEPIEAWQLTAYALSELDAADANRVERALERDSDLRSEYEQIQQTLGAVRSVLSPTNSVIALDKKQSDLVAQGIARSATLNPAILVLNAKVSLDGRPFYRRKRFAALLATAALVPLAISYWPSRTRQSGFAMTQGISKSSDVQQLITHESAKSNEALPLTVKDLLASRTSEVPRKRNGWIAEQDISGVVEKGDASKKESTTLLAFDQPLSKRDSEEARSSTTSSDPRSKIDGVSALAAAVPADLDRRMSLGRASNALDAKGFSRGEAGSGAGVGGYGGGGIFTSGAAPGGTAPEHIAIANDAKLAEGKSSDEKKLPAELRLNAPDAFRERAIEKQSGDRFEKIIETPFVATEQAPLSTFSIDVDTASYSKIRQYLNQSNSMPNPNMVRIEEMINYFEYEYSGPKDDAPFAAHMAVAQCPWNLEHRLVRIGLQARKIDMKQRPKANIVFLLDVSGSMNEPNKLPLVKKSLSLLAAQLTENDNVAIVVYAGAAGCVLPSTNGANKQAILSSLEHLNAGGSTNGGQGIQLAYSIAKEHFIEGGVNRVILCTDGDFNVGVTGDSALVEMMQANAKSNIFLTCLGFGMGNYNDTMMEKISNQGNGIYGMIDNEIEARRMMVEQLAGTLVTVAKDVKIQVDFNPNKVAGYRLIGYEDRRLANKDFDNDQKDAGEIGAGHRVTALYEVIPAGKSIDATPRNDGEASKYQQKPKAEPKPADPVVGSEFASELLTLKVRYKQPEGSVSTKQEFVLKESDRDEQPQVDRDMQWATAVAEFGLLLRRSNMAPNADWSRMLERAEMATQGDAYRLECVQMMRKARSLSGNDSRQK
jgi:Ca-activated chloride channel family protein